METRTRTQGKTWVRRSIGGVLMLAFTSFFAPVPPADAMRPEVIYVTECSPGTTEIGGVCWPDPLTEPGLLPDSGDGNTGGGNSLPPLFDQSMIDAITERIEVQANLQELKGLCTANRGRWARATFKDFDSGITLMGWGCRNPGASSGATYTSISYFDQHADYNKTCRFYNDAGYETFCFSDPDSFIFP